MWTKGNFLVRGPWRGQLKIYAVLAERNALGSTLQKTQQFPQDAGYPFGYNTDNSIFDTFIIRFHYVNPNLETNITDRTAIQFFYTPNTRANAIGSLTVGGFSSWQAISIPPGAGSLQTTFDCFATCVNVSWCHFSLFAD